MFKKARETDFPKSLSGCGKRRLKGLKDKDPSRLTKDDKLFLEYHDYIMKKRSIYYEKKLRMKIEEEGDAEKDETTSDTTEKKGEITSQTKEMGTISQTEEKPEEMEAV